MSLGRRIELQIAALAVLGGVLFGLGESQPILPLGLLLAAGLATRQAGGRPRFSLPAWAVNGLIFVIAIVSAWRYAYAYGTAEVVVLGHAFGGLQAVLVFERKTARTRWDLLSLSLLTVFLSTSLVQGPLFALGLLGYCLARVFHAGADLPGTRTAVQRRPRRRRTIVSGGRPRARQLVAAAGDRGLDADRGAAGPVSAISRAARSRVWPGRDSRSRRDRTT